VSEAPGRWAPLTPQEAVLAMARFGSPWWVAGGWAIDLFLGRQTRGHGDLDIEILRRDQLELRRALGGWQLHVARGGQLWPWPEGSEVPPDANSLWCRTGDGRPWRFQVMLADSDGERWVYRRHRAVSKPINETGNRTADGVPYLVPEVELLFKAKDSRPTDEADFEATLPRMASSSRRWLLAALERVDPGHPWTDRLSRS